jgi:hypothetical protein
VQGGPSLGPPMPNKKTVASHPTDKRDILEKRQ